MNDDYLVNSLSTEFQLIVVNQLIYRGLTEQTQKIYITFVQRQHCTNVIQMFCVYWVHLSSENLCRPTINNTCKLVNQLRYSQQPSRHTTLNQCWFNVGPPSTTLDQRLTNIGSTSFVRRPLTYE